ncbi:GM12399 [Drosophila sechellia]|uniref:GM12399 n=1 Tax=Drosophila sechellia TaxID=7238 RepID=B4I0R0_DROSE|nr:GM12399 [Drosophila sechellia]
MSYQIKSTPYFRRMFNESKKNGQLQRLRDEYERIQEFNDRTIEMKMRQVRLKRLFREIEVIKVAGGGATGGASGGGTSTAASPSNVGQSAGLAGGRVTRRRRQQAHGATTLASGTPQQRMRMQRLETLARARQLGQEISRRNGLMAEAGTGGFLRSELRMTAKLQAANDARRAAVERRELAAKRISYGNDQSRQNIQRMLIHRQRRHEQQEALAATAAAKVEASNSSQVSIEQRVTRPVTRHRHGHGYTDYCQQQELLAVTMSGRRTQGDHVQMECEGQSDTEHSFHSNDCLAHSMDEDVRARGGAGAAGLLRMLHKGRSHGHFSSARRARRPLALIAPLAPLAPLPHWDTLATAATSPRDMRQVKSSIDSYRAVGGAQSSTIASHQPSGTVPPPLDDELQLDSQSNSSRWHEVSMMLSWFRAVSDIPSECADAPPPDAPVPSHCNCDSLSNADDVPSPTGCRPQRMYAEQPSDAGTQAQEEPF